MPDAKISALVEDTTPATGDFVVTNDVSAGDNKKVKLDTLWTKKPGVGVTAYKSAANQSISNATITKVVFDAEEMDTNGMHDNVTNNTRLTVPAGYGGLWLLRGQGVWVANAIGNRELFWKVNDTTYPKGSNRNATLGGTDAVYMAAPTIAVQLSAGDYMEMVCYQTSGGALDLAISDTVASMIFLGA